MITQRVHAGLTVIAVALSMSGCARITAQVVEKPRVDQELKGNRGYLAGTPPPVPARKDKRQMIQTDIELPTADELMPWKTRKPSKGQPTAQAPATNAPAASAPSRGMPEEEWKGSGETPVAPARTREGTPPAATYIVKQGDTLEKIAAQVYGDGSKWRRIYQANRDRLSSPNKIYPGQKLMVPAAAQSEKKTHQASSSDLK